ncbi:hypothetical protein R3P38DRAFT_537688 [Favolaschia claudopus]|uniref:Uncharacterized protein n=1 Tax=Favolaschia claudopus TaxID=2862362 RepID=A0AAW0CGH3_9AGAR
MHVDCLRAICSSLPTLTLSLSNRYHLLQCKLPISPLPSPSLRFDSFPAVAMAYQHPSSSSNNYQWPQGQIPPPSFAVEQHARASATLQFSSDKPTSQPQYDPAHPYGPYYRPNSNYEHVNATAQHAQDPVLPHPTPESLPLHYQALLHEAQIPAPLAYNFAGVPQGNVPFRPVLPEGLPQYPQYPQGQAWNMAPPQGYYPNADGPVQAPVELGKRQHADAESSDARVPKRFCQDHEYYEAAQAPMFPAVLPSPTVPAMGQLPLATLPDGSTLPPPPPGFKWEWPMLCFQQGLTMPFMAVNPENAGLPQISPIGQTRGMKLVFGKRNHDLALLDPAKKKKLLVNIYRGNQLEARRKREGAAFYGNEFLDPRAQHAPWVLRIFDNREEYYESNPHLRPPPQEEEAASMDVATPRQQFVALPEVIDSSLQDAGSQPSEQSSDIVDMDVATPRQQPVSLPEVIDPSLEVEDTQQSLLDLLNEIILFNEVNEAERSR